MEDTPTPLAAGFGLRGKRIWCRVFPKPLKGPLSLSLSHAGERGSTAGAVDERRGVR